MWNQMACFWRECTVGCLTMVVLLAVTRSAGLPNGIYSSIFFSSQHQSGSATTETMYVHWPLHFHTDLCTFTLTCALPCWPLHFHFKGIWSMIISIERLLSFNFFLFCLQESDNEKTEEDVDVVVSTCTCVKVKVSCVTLVSKQAKTAFLLRLIVWKVTGHRGANVSLGIHCTNHCTCVELPITIATSQGPALLLSMTVAFVVLFCISFFSSFHEKLAESRKLLSPFSWHRFSHLLSQKKRGPLVCRGYVQNAIAQWHHMPCRSTFPDHSWIKVFVNIEVYWPRGLLNELEGAMREESIRELPFFRWRAFLLILYFFVCLSGCRAERTARPEWSGQESGKPWQSRWPQQRIASQHGELGVVRACARACVCVCVCVCVRACVCW